MASLPPFLFLLVLASAAAELEHSGAYSSPQYAKKMYPKGFDANALLPREKPPLPFKRQYDTQIQTSASIDRFDGDYNDTSQYGRSTFLSSAGDFLSGAGGQMVTSLAKDFIARSTGSSQVGFDCISQVRIAPFSVFCTLTKELRNSLLLCMGF